MLRPWIGWDQKGYKYLRRPVGIDLIGYGRRILEHPMSSTPLEPIKSPETAAPILPDELVRNRGVIAWSSFFFALLQSICGAVVAITGLRVAIGIGALALSTGAGAAMVRFHTDAIRVPMIVLALLGSLLNLAILMHVRHLRSRPASQWRQKPLSIGQKRTELAQLVLSLATLVLIAGEEYLHLSLHHSL
jgi:hypothetical protein